MKNTFVQLVKNAIINSGRTRTREELLHLSDRTLEDSGFSRVLLTQGNNAWPWRMATPSSVMSAPTTVSQKVVVSQPTVSSARKDRKAIQELQSLSNAELADIGITRGEIEQVVKYGRDRTEQAGLQSAA